MKTPQRKIGQVYRRKISKHERYFYLLSYVNDSIIMLDLETGTVVRSVFTGDPNINEEVWNRLVGEVKYNLIAENICELMDLAVF